jgi:hypothetical protein
MRCQVMIPDDLSEARYISGVHALNLPAPERTSGDWHFSNVYYHSEESVITLAGTGEEIDTNFIFGNYGIYLCNEALKNRGLKADGKTYYAANHFRAVLDLLYERIEKGKYPYYLTGASEDYFDTEEEKKILLEKSCAILPYLPLNKQNILLEWINKERLPGYKS